MAFKSAKSVKNQITMSAGHRRHTSAAPPPKKATLSACVRNLVCTARKAPSSRYCIAANEPKSGVTALRGGSRALVDERAHVKRR